VLFFRIPFPERKVVQGKLLYFDKAQDRDLETRVRRTLEGMHRRSLLGLAIEAENGEVTVRGQVGSFYEKQLALAGCRRVAGVVKVNEAVEVIEPAIV
jgi:osmotically-inducible protein OsmY